MNIHGSIRYSDGSDPGRNEIVSRAFLNTQPGHHHYLTSESESYTTSSVKDWIQSKLIGSDVPQPVDITFESCFQNRHQDANGEIYYKKMSAGEALHNPAKYIEKAWKKEKKSTDCRKLLYVIVGFSSYPYAATVKDISDDYLTPSSIVLEEMDKSYKDELLRMRPNYQQ